MSAALDSRHAGEAVKATAWRRIVYPDRYRVTRPIEAAAMLTGCEDTRAVHEVLACLGGTLITRPRAWETEERAKYDEASEHYARLVARLRPVWDARTALRLEAYRRAVGSQSLDWALGDVDDWRTRVSR